MLATILPSWDSMVALEKVYWCIAIPFSALFLIQLVVSMFGGDADGVEGDADLSVEGDAGIEFQFLSLKNMIAFFTIFAWVGIVTIDGGLPHWAVLLISSVCGMLMMLIMASIMYFMGKLTESGTLNLNNAKGKIATVYLTIPAKRDGMGKVQIQVQGLRTLDALTDDEKEIKTGAVVEVVDVINNEILLVKLNS